jgi:hypothetical protein
VREGIQSFGVGQEVVSTLQRQLTKLNFWVPILPSKPHQFGEPKLNQSYQSASFLLGWLHMVKHQQRIILRRKVDTATPLVHYVIVSLRG